MSDNKYIKGLDDDEDDDIDDHIANQKDMLDEYAFAKKPNSKIEVGWDNVLQFLRDKQKQMDLKETEWMIEKHQLQQKISMLEAQNKAFENSNNDCIRRIKMLEFALRQERIRYARAANGIEGKLDILKDHPDIIEDEKLPERVPYQKPQGHQSILLKFLEEIGFEEVFNSTDVSGIKELFDKAANSLSQNQELLESVQKIESDVRSKVQKEEKAAELQNEIKEFSHKDKLNRILNPINKSKGTSLNKQSQNYENEDGLEDKFNSSFDSVKKLDSNEQDEDVKAEYGDNLYDINLRHEFNVHLDSVRGVEFIDSLDCMASVSEDCTVKLWDVKLMHKNMEDGFGEGIEFKGDPYYTLRGHTGPLFKIAGSIINDKIIYTAGNEGVVRIWRVPDLEDVDVFGADHDQYDFCLGTLNGHSNEPIWDLKHHPTLPLLVSMGADDSLCLWKAYSQEDDCNSQEKMTQIHENLVHRFMYESQINNKQFYETPTCCEWLHSNISYFIVSYARDFMVIFDYNSGKIVSEYKTIGNPNKIYIEKQINTFVCHPLMNAAITGTEDGAWAIYDLADYKCVERITDAHEDGISCVTLSANKNHFYTGSHDGMIKLWDMRNYKCFGEIKAHEKKYDEAVMSMMVHPNHPVLVTCGADSSIKWFETNP